MDRMPAKIRAFLFDMDGLLIDSEGLMMRAYIRMVADDGRTLRTEDLKPFIGSPHRVGCTWLVENGFCQGPPEAVTTRAMEIFLQMMADEQPPPLPGVREIFALGEKLRLKRALVSSSTPYQVDPTMLVIGGHLGFKSPWREQFHIVCTGDRVKNKKPAPDLYLLALEELKLQPEECLAFEDSPAGVTAAHAAGVRVCAIPNMHLDAEAVTQGKADFCFDSLLSACAGLPRVLEA
jgi:beta-phosphoglucomutase-like phosphatase (HAD superfamily)